MNTEQRTNKLIADQLGVSIDNVTPDKSLVDDLCADSLDTVELAMAFEDEFDIFIPDDDIDSIRSVSDYHEYIAKKLGNKTLRALKRN